VDAKIERVQSPDVNAWLIGDDEEVIVIDPGSDTDAVLAAVGEREILAVICTHGHREHIAGATVVADRDEAPIALHSLDLVAWRETHLDGDPDIAMADGGMFEVADVTLEVMHSPGHSPGSVCLYCEDLGVVFTGDTLLASGPATHDGDYPDFAGQLTAIGEQLLTLPATTTVLPAHGEEITVAAAAKLFDSWASTRGTIVG
jgi:glyoxylase-like metal-dependent hydrolase (beta-lactamase superfamily II)